MTKPYDMFYKVLKLTKEKFPFLFSIISSGRSFLKHKLSRRKVAHLLKADEHVRLELGGGGKKGKPGWVTLDMMKNCDIFWDLRKGLPFPQESVKKIYSSHFFEHLSYRETQKLLDECKRVLIPEGKFSVCVPNARIYMESYLKGEHLDESIFCSYKPAYNKTTNIDRVNYVAYMDGHHKYMFDEQNLLHILKVKGFKNVRLRKFDPELDQKGRDFNSIYAEAEK